MYNIKTVRCFRLDFLPLTFGVPSSQFNTLVCRIAIMPLFAEITTLEAPLSCGNCTDSLWARLR